VEERSHSRRQLPPADHLLLRKPITGIAGSRASAASGHAAAAPPSNDMNSRRLMAALTRSPRRQRASSVDGISMPSNCEQQAYHWRSPSWAKYTIVNIRWKRTQRDFSGNLLKTAKIKGSINSTPLTFHK
jgi:hypothetical protein